MSHTDPVQQRLVDFNLNGCFPGVVCNRTFDKYACWPDALPNTTVSVACPWYLPWHKEGTVNITFTFIPFRTIIYIATIAKKGVVYKGLFSGFKKHKSNLRSSYTCSSLTLNMTVQ